MGRNSGGVTGSTKAKGSGLGTKGATEEGYTRTMIKNIVGLEQGYRGNKDETLHVFTPTGKLIRSIGGKGAAVQVPDMAMLSTNAILTHNHPRAIGQKGLAAIGNSFSHADINLAVRANASEMRAVTPTYTFSMKRPKGGWNATPQQVVDAFKAAEKKTRSRMQSYIDNYKGSWKTAVERANTMHYHLIWKEVAKQMGWNYSKKRG